MHEIKYFLVACAASFLAFISMAGVVRAETHITEGFLYENAVWTATGSPYILETTLTVPAGRSIVVEPGVTIFASSTEEGYSNLDIQGDLLLNGSENSKIKVSGFGEISIYNGSASISNADITILGGVNVLKSILDIRDTTITGTMRGLRVESSKVNISGSRITQNQVGLWITGPFAGAFLMQGDDPSRSIGGIGNALQDLVISPKPTILAQSVPKAPSSEVAITNSEIHDNTESGIQNYDTSVVSAPNNWWGSANGPSTVGANKIIGPINYSPWLVEPPKKVVTCCSSILFIPGLEGTRLYRDSTLPFGMGSSTNQLWEPNRNADVQKLYLGPDGSSTDSAIYSGQPIDKGCFAGICKAEVYGKFMTFLDDLIQKNTINEWKAFGYDWRKPISEVVAGIEKKATTSQSLIGEVASIASRSKTGKVTLVAHSNGGLVAKYLVKTLTDLGKESLIDSVISVAVPYLGTPEAIGALLYGDHQSILGGLVLSKNIARGLAQNMPSAYTLLPSREYFNNILSPTIANAATYDDQVKEVSKGGANTFLTTAADIVHGILDPFSWPPTIVNWAILGWNKSTTKGISNKIAATTIMGDGTVVAPSAAFNAKTVVSIDLNTATVREKNEIAHANILGASATKSVVENIVTSRLSENEQATIDKISKIEGVTIGAPDYSKQPSFLLLSTHSPVDLGVYDSKGRHTGIIPLPTGYDIEDSPYVAAYETNIPGSKFESRGGTDEDPEYQIYLSDDNGETYSIVMNGTGLGEFTFDIERVRNGSYVDKIRYAGMPVTPLTVATTSVKAQLSEFVLPPLFASSSPKLNIDIDGNGTPDVVVTPNTKVDTSMYLELLRKTIENSHIKPEKSKNILKRIERLEGLVKNDKTKKLIRVSAVLQKRVIHMQSKKISDTDRKEILNLIDLFLAQYE